MVVEWKMAMGCGPCPLFELSRWGETRPLI